MNAAQRRSAAGFTLVELMIALLISLLLLVGVLHIMLSNRESLRAQKALSGLQSRAHLLNVVLGDSVAAAGYRVDPQDDPSNVFAAASGSGAVAPYDVNLAVGAAVGGQAEGNNDVLRVRFQAKGGLHDCLGQAVGDNSTNTPQIGSFALRLNPANNDLYCYIYPPGGSARVPQPLVSDVERFKVLYGIYSGTGKGSVDTYRTNLPANLQSHVVSLRIQALLRTKQRVLSTPTARTFDFADGTTVNTGATRRAYLMLDRTIALPNALP